MKTIKIALVLIISIIIASGCKKDNTPQTTNNAPTTYPDYSELKPGNYWIYEEFTLDTLGNATATGVYDSGYVAKDTAVINGKTYFKEFRPKSIQNFGFLLLRDSSGYLVDSTGFIYFSSQDFTTIFNVYYSTGGNDTFFKAFSKMADKNQVVSVPGGTFTTSSFQETFVMYGAYRVFGLNRYLNTRYAEKIGIVSETLPFEFPALSYTELRLVRYHIQ